MRVLRVVLVLGVLCLVAGCSSSSQFLQTQKTVSLQWPEKPLSPRVEWVKSVVSPEDAGIAKGFWKRTLELLTGASTQRIVKPYGVLYDDGRLFIADPGAGVVHVMDTKRSLYSMIRSQGDAVLRSPIGLARDSGNGLYITDSVSDAVYRYDVASETLSTFVRAIDRPTGIAYNKTNNLLYITETGANDVVGVDMKGLQKVRFSNVNPGRQLLNHPTDLAVDPKGQVFVTDPLNYKVRAFTPEGVQVYEIGEMGDANSELSKPKGVAVDALGRIFLCDAMSDIVKVFDAQGNYLFGIGGTGTANGQFWMPSGIAISGDFLFVADTYNRRVQMLRLLPIEEEDEDYDDEHRLGQPDELGGK
ncbi:SMP-30/gluconolactonase/LRE family protein [Geomonas anaerohicana]|uniref:SMP-30/gluconolactonase/LRE family protein n=1 Tax=Geomonas anaerohicana TaxID=2798583 RepID=A0ABS0YH49_9BACT|nr:SMP-30/gluconolactonase/LRE family protein [Geomonas anaerohicana]MBJ6751593.1 SMP-30/gluconolactonase/LRE family protein [Geomonas anaerohicana]